MRIGAIRNHPECEVVEWWAMGPGSGRGLSSRQVLDAGLRDQRAHGCEKRGGVRLAFRRGDRLLVLAAIVTPVPELAAGVVCAGPLAFELAKQPMSSGPSQRPHH
ncbi:MAG TPA: hypothetical protein VIJ31_04255 [Acidothermaceae bacterium]